MGLRLDEVATLVAGRLEGGANASTVIDGVGPIEEAGPAQIAALDGERFLAQARASRAAALLVPAKLATQIDRPRIVVASPQIAQNAVIERLGLWRWPWPREGRHPTAVVDPTAQIGEGVAIGAYAAVGAGARLGAGTQLEPHAVVEASAVVGARCVVQSHAVVCSCATLGDECVVGHGAVVGGEGFGFGFGPTGPVRLRHLGRVILGNRVHVGNGTTIDRARFGDSRVGDDVKLDSHVHLGHNVVVGARTILAAHTGVAGSSEIGENCLLGGQVGIADHVKITSNVRLAARSGIGSNVEEAGDYFGFWAKERGVAMRELAAVAKLPDALREVSRLRREVDELRARLGGAK
jgi:UDP-3-O-[3-hydroxymyristoyl] glucosamine N-acyltransferase